LTARIALIAAVGTNGVIGAGNEIPWRLPSDFAFFKRTTMGKPVVMGRKTFESIGKPLPGRINIVVTRQQGYQPEGVLVINELGAALDHARALAAADGVEEVFVAGGGEIYRAAMPSADRLYITHVEAAPEGDTSFPAIDSAIWEIVAEPEIVPTGKDRAAFHIRIYERKRPPSH
jgi:dihydrofolate reductase